MDKKFSIGGVCKNVAISRDRSHKRHVRIALVISGFKLINGRRYVVSSLDLTDMQRILHFSVPLRAMVAIKKTFLDV